MSVIKKQIFSIADLAPFIAERVSGGASVRFTVTGNSMFPLFANRRDQVTVTAPTDIRKYDIVLHRRTDGTYILHRVIGRRGDVLTIAGDNETERETGVNISQVIAKVTGFTRKGRDVSVNNPLYRVYSRLWLAVFPARHIILAILLIVRRAFSHAKGTDAR